MVPRQFLTYYLFLGLILTSFVVLAHPPEAVDQSVRDDEAWDDLEETVGPLDPFDCKKAKKIQIAQVNVGNRKLNDFLRLCARETNGSPWCRQLTRPNPDSYGVFRCTYGEKQIHQLIHPDQSTWKHAFKAVQLIGELEELGIRTCIVYNWWRPEPYNANVGGSPSRHPFGTSVDVRFCSLDDMERAFVQLCKWRSEGRMKAVGYYGTTGLHFGIGDRIGNTWGKDCP